VKLYENRAEINHCVHVIWLCIAVFH